MECKLTIAGVYLKERRLPDLSSIKVEEVNAEHQESIMISPEVDDKECFGGVILKNKAQNIVLKNTLDLRTELAFQKGLPQIRQIIMPRNK
jgi:vacuolar-type H+-ATPase subunit E/Vma4